MFRSESKIWGKYLKVIYPSPLQNNQKEMKKKETKKK
jgi:hypothetical protein